MPSPCSLLVLFCLCFAATSLTAQVPEPRSLGFEAGSLGTLPEPWFVPTTLRGWRGELTADDAAVGERSVTLRRHDATGPAVGNLMCTLPATDLQGKRVRLRAQLRVAEGGRAQMWLRVDRRDDRMGAFDNMHDRPLRQSEWTEAVIELDVAGDAVGLALGFVSFDGTTVSIDDVTLTVTGDGAPTQPTTAPAPLTDRERINVVAASRLLGYLWFFHPSDPLVELTQWDHFAVDLLTAALPATDDADLCTRLAAFVAPVAPTVQLWRGTVDEAPAAAAAPADATQLRHWEHQGAGRVARGESVYHSEVVEQPLEPGATPAAAVVILAGSVCARVPTELYADGDHSLPRAEIPAAWLPRWQVVLGLQHRTTRMAAVAQAWNVFQHFYPYFDDVEADWAAELPRTLQLVAAATDDAAASVALERMVAALHDGHGSVSGVHVGSDSMLPIAVRWIGDQLVVTGVAPNLEDVRVGDVVQQIDGKPVGQLYAEMVPRISAATEGWSRTRSQWMFASWPTANPVRLSVRRGDGSMADVTAKRGNQVVDEAARRPANGSEVAPGIVYFDLNGTSEADLDPHLDVLKQAKAIVFDLRGYPNSAAIEVLRMRITGPAESARWGIPIVTRPDRHEWRWNELGRWRLLPRLRLDAEVAFLTNGRAISYAESIMGIVEAYRLGEIVGSTTAGTNGNVNPFVVAGGLQISWTGMRVQKHDGSRHHGVGIAPTVPVTPTIAGIAAGRDEVLERAIEVLQQKLGR